MPERGCGSRVEGGLYAICPCSPFGKPVEYFLIDPAIPWGHRQLRGPMLVESQKHKGLHHVIIGVGKEFYPFVPDFIEEVRVMGVSKRFPRNFPIEKLTPGQSRMIFLHLNAIPKFDYKNNTKCPKDLNHKPCIKDLWNLSALESVKKKHVVTVESMAVRVDTPSVQYYIDLPDKPEMGTKKKLGYKAGLFASFPIWFFSYVTRKGKMPKDLKERFQKSKFKLKVEPE